MGNTTYNNQAYAISYKGFCALGALSNPACWSRVVTNQRGEYLYTLYFYQPK